MPLDSTPDSTGRHALPPGHGSRRKHILVRVAGDGWAAYDGTDKQWSQIA